MIEERFTEEERQYLKRVVLDDVGLSTDPPRARRMALRVLSLLNGTDTVIIAHRAYPARSSWDGLPRLR